MTMTDAERNAQAQQHRDNAVKADLAAQESWERSDTDGFMSQWASGLTAARERLQADIIEDGGRAMFPALFDLEGALIAAKRVEGRHGMVWGLLGSDNPDDGITGWFGESNASRKGAARRNDAKKGYYIGYVMANAKADLRGSNATSVRAVAVRTDGGFSRDVEIIDNGVGETDMHRWYDIYDGTV
jgi:hypothetical protein